MSCLDIVFRGLELTRIIIGSLWSLRRMKSVRYSLRQSGYRQWCPGHDRPFCTRNLSGDVLLERSVFALILLPQDAGTCRLTLLMVWTQNVLVEVRPDMPAKSWQTSHRRNISCPIIAFLRICKVCVRKPLFEKWVALQLAIWIMRVALSYPFSVLLSYLVISTSMQVTAVSHSTIQHVNTLVSDVLKKD